MDLEGIVSKRPASRCKSGNTKAWLKTKTFTDSDFEAIGVEQSTTGIPVEPLARPGQRPAYVGSAMITLGGKDREEFWRRIDALGTPRSRLKELHKHMAQWIGPGLTAKVRHLRGEHKLRHATVLKVEGRN